MKAFFITLNILFSTFYGLTVSAKQLDYNVQRKAAACVKGCLQSEFAGQRKIKAQVAKSAFKKCRFQCLNSSAELSAFLITSRGSARSCFSRVMKTSATGSYPVATNQNADCVDAPLPARPLTSGSFPTATNQTICRHTGDKPAVALSNIMIATGQALSRAAECATSPQYQH